MTNVLLIAHRFCPPWSDGTISYARGLVDTILESNRSGKNLQITVLSSREKTLFPKFNCREMKEYLESRGDTLECFYAPERRYKANLWKLVRKLSQAKNYDIIHILIPGFNPLWMRIATKNRNIVLKHIFIYPFHSAFTAEKLAYNFFQRSSMFKLFNIDLVFSNKILQEIYHTEGLTILPPAIDTHFYHPEPKSDCSYKALTEPSLKFGNGSEVFQKDVVLLYMGPLLKERFDFKNVINGFKKLHKEYGIDVGLAIVGRELGGASYFDEIKDYIRKNDFDDCVFACLKNLSEVEKACLFNSVDVFIYPFPRKLRRMSVVFPPIALLESMSAGISVVSGGLPYLSFLIKNHENGILIKETINEETFAEGVWNALLDKRKISKNARLTIERNFSIQHVSKLYADFLSKAGI